MLLVVAGDINDLGALLVYDAAVPVPGDELPGLSEIEVGVVGIDIMVDGPEFRVLVMLGTVVAAQLALDGAGLVQDLLLLPGKLFLFLLPLVFFMEQR